MAASLLGALAPFSPEGYRSLFVTAFPRKTLKGWEVTRKPLSREEKTTAYAELTYCLSCAPEATAELGQICTLARRINEVWYRSSIRSFFVTPNEAGAILFSSHREGYHYLSNFFPTCIVFESRVYPSAEHAYQSTRLQLLGLETDLRRPINASPQSLKEEVAGILERKGRDLDLDRRISLLTAVALAKFQQNLVLADCLIATVPHPLIEETKSPLWGRGPDGLGKNLFGTILERVREQLTTASREAPRP